MPSNPTTRDMTAQERAAACDRYTRWIELRAQMQSEWNAIVANRKAGQVSL